ncbi:hypothetical protein MELLADRAFT_90067 [Melampsora larici-populina 98AG31]|uniref:Uncharacterized protein n=2 Tax=Melampsora larici-populina (strain 98AG31 / pathotype 3-4-7) TaxID=747676 RepID=F4RVK9_MELLP|nr:hypothetical protein MELLADRAFT_90067 [Melampsora larici-populina 98AG31]
MNFKISMNPINSKDCYLGPYHNELTASRPICAVKHCRAESVVRWGTTCEYSGAPVNFNVFILMMLCSEFQADQVPDYLYGSEAERGGWTLHLTVKSTSYGTLFIMFRLLSLVQAIEQAKLNTIDNELSLMCMIKVHVRKSDLQERLYEMPCGSMDESLKGSLSQCTIKFITLTLKSIRVHSLRASPVIKCVYLDVGKVYCVLYLPWAVAHQGLGNTLCDFMLLVREMKGATCYLVDPASSHMLVSKIKPCMSKYKQLYSETANGSLNQL